MLLDECAASKVDIRTSHRIANVSKSDRFRVATDRVEFEADAVVLATGGLSIPRDGRDGTCARYCQALRTDNLGYPAWQVPLTFDGETLEMLRPLSGVSLECTVGTDQISFREALLFTHRGLSGPAILQISSFWRDKQEIFLNLMPDTDANALLLDGKRARPRSETRTILSNVLPARFAAAIAETHLPARPIGEISDKELSRLGQILNGWTLVPVGTEGYAKAEVTLGGIDTNNLSSRSMEAKDVPGLYAIGEAVDVTGWLGGYNFQWAWSSGYAAGQAV